MFLFRNVTNVPFVFVSLGTAPGLGLRPETLIVSWEGKWGKWGIFFYLGTILMFLFSLRMAPGLGLRPGTLMVSWGVNGEFFFI